VIIAIALFVLVIIAEAVALHLLMNKSTATHESASFRYFHWEVRNNLAPKYMKADKGAKELAEDIQKFLKEAGKYENFGKDNFPTPRFINNWKSLLEIHKVVGKNLKLMEFQKGAVATLHKTFLDHNGDIIKLCLDQTSAANKSQIEESAKKMKTLEPRMDDLIKDFDKLSKKHGLRTFKEIEEIYRGEPRKKEGLQKRSE